MKIELSESQLRVLMSALDEADANAQSDWKEGTGGAKKRSGEYYKLEQDVKMQAGKQGVTL